ncbi:MAG TPA: aminodeoxychorismate/anthranilate synthase component II [Ignavibacteriales bacterium]|nr:aminodeoxychorismate/anthranilate synthase component II [Ignavibacteriales bacterium]HRR18903.1 aminodeoxychorismate/anthranilate synthase component II [Ignavibacteriales bacterium]HRT98627.1 aminodeoxychorismate/anthranilate synthase component II [Ignavibacteriales bacterium]
MKILIIDCYDSFTFNLYQYFKILETDVDVVCYDEKNLLDVVRNYDNIVLSPGPGKPADYPILKDVIERKKGAKILGICLGMQVIAEYLGCGIIQAKQPVHGYTSKIYHIKKGIFNGIPNGINVMRYHSLIIKCDTVSHNLSIIAKTYDNIPMAIKHNKYNIWGLQYHPEAYLTEYGIDVLKNWCML